MSTWKECIGYKTVGQLFSDESEGRCIIPAYQRHYTWEVSLIEELITDICRHIENNERKGEEAPPYHLGSVVLAQTKESSPYEIVDGQQRMLSLWLILHALGKLPPSDKLGFSEVREKANKFLKDIRGSLPYPSPDYSDDNSTKNLCNAYNYLKDLFQTRFQTTIKTDKIDQERFKDFLLRRTLMLVTVLPPQTDVSLYFERMNDRGEQMQATDVVKAYLFEKLSVVEQSQADTIWTACSNMSRFIQSNFEISSQNSDSSLSRTQLFTKNWTDFCPTESIDLFQNSEVCDKEKADSPANQTRPTFDVFLSKEIQTNSKGLDKNKETFLPVTDFAHLLLYALNIYEAEFKSSEPVALNEDNLITEFRLRLKNSNVENWGNAKVKEFLFTLLKCRWLLDTYVIKSTQEKEESWNVWRYEKTDNNNTSYCLTFKEEDSKNIRLLMSAMHCSNSNQNYKNWLDCVLRWLFENAPTKGIRELKENENADFVGNYQKFLRTLAFLLFAKTTNPAVHALRARQWSSDPTIIFENITNPDFEKSLNYRSISVYQLNYIDYLLYQKCAKAEAGSFMGLNEENLKLLKQKRSNFHFSSARTSIDHFVPQTRPKTFDMAVYEKIRIDDLANLSLMSPEQNTRHLNDNPLTKRTTISIKDSISLKTLILALSVEQLNLDHQNADWSKLPEKWNKLQQEFESLIIEDHEEEKKLLENMNHSDQKSP